MLPSPCQVHASGSADGSAQGQWNSVSPGPRSPVFEPLYDSGTDEEAAVEVSQSLEGSQSTQKHRRSSSFSALLRKTRSSTPPPKMSGTALRSRGKAGQSGNASDPSINARHSAGASEQDESKDPECKVASVPFLQQPAFRLCVLSFTVAWLGAAFMFFFAFSSHNLDLSPGKQHLLTANSLFASSIRLSPLKAEPGLEGRAETSLNATAFLFLMNLPRQKVSHHPQLGQKDLSLPGQGIKIWTAWLNRGSTVSLSFSVPESGVKFAVLKGGRDLKQWESRHTGATLRGKGRTDYACQEGGVYHFAFYNLHSAQVQADLLLDVARMHFDTSNTAAECQLSWNKQKACLVTLPFGAPVFVVMETSEKNKTGRSPTEDRSDGLKATQEGVVHVSYEPRVISYLVLLSWPFGVSFLAFLLSIMHQQKQHKSPGVLIAANVLSASTFGSSSMEGLNGEDSGHFRASIVTKQTQQHQLRLEERIPLFGASSSKAE